MPVRWGIESTRYHGPNLISCKIVTGITWNPLIGAYLPLSTLENLPDLEEALQRFRDPIILGDLNMDLDDVRSPRSQQVAYLFEEYVLIDLVRNFLQLRRFRNLKTWSQVWQGTVLRSRCDSILGTHRRHLNIFEIQEMRNFSSDHFALRAWLLRCPTLFHARYLWGRRAFALRSPPTAELSRYDSKVQTLKTLEPPPPQAETPPSTPMDVPILYQVD